MGFQSLNQQIQNFFENQKDNIWSALILIGVVDVLFAAFFVPQFFQTHLCRNYMLLGSQLQSCSTLEFVKYGWNLLAFANLFVFLPAIIWAMIMPHMVKEAAEANQD